jgi:two-component system sensor histidine kinase KdpD
MVGKRKFQYPVSILTILGVALLCFLLNDFIGYQAVALVLLLAVSLLALVFDIWPVLIAAILSAIIWNFFFIPPQFTFYIREAEDILMFLMYFMVALVHAVLTTKIKAQEKKARDKEEKEKAILLYNTLFNSLSHELKTPISTIIGAADTLREQNQSLSTEAKQSLVTEIQIAATRLHQQVENLLSMGRLESGHAMRTATGAMWGSPPFDRSKVDPLLQKRLYVHIGINCHYLNRCRPDRSRDLQHR